MDAVNTSYVYMETGESYITIGETVYPSYSDTVKTSSTYTKTVELHIAKGDIGSDFYGYIVKSDPDISVESNTVETLYLYAERAADNLKTRNSTSETAYNDFAYSDCAQKTSGAPSTTEETYSDSSYSRRTRTSDILQATFKLHHLHQLQ